MWFEAWCEMMGLDPSEDGVYEEYQEWTADNSESRYA